MHLPIKEVERANPGDFFRWAKMAVTERYGRLVSLGMDKDLAVSEAEELLGAKRSEHGLAAKIAAVFKNRR